tara:strand:- start:626 stop:1234 length:609 start_codon:yes stop_codon:yes gene_type:complete
MHHVRFFYSPNCFRWNQLASLNLYAMTSDSVRLMHYDPRWRQEFEQTRSNILSSCEGWITGAQHIGSTAISGLIARPTIDVVATTAEEKGLDRAASLIEGLNFRCVDTPLWADGAITLIKPRSLSAESSDLTHRVFLVVAPSAMLLRAVAYRNYLRKHPEVAIELEEVKVASWREHDGDLDAYQKDKAAFFVKIQDQIDPPV